MKAEASSPCILRWISGNRRACAGAVAAFTRDPTNPTRIVGINPDPVHTAVLRFKAYQDGKPLKDEPLRFSFLPGSNPGVPNEIDSAPVIARFVQTLPTGDVKLTGDPINITTSGVDGSFTLTILSGQVVRNPTVAVEDLRALPVQIQLDPGHNTFEPLPNIPLDFAAADSLRHYGLSPQSPYNDEADTGWDFLSGLSPRDNGTVGDMLVRPGDEITARVYMKFQIDPTVSRDTNYFDANGKPLLPSDSANWLPVAGHWLRIRVKKLLLRDQQVKPDTGQTLDNFVMLLNANNAAVSELLVRTDADGTATFRLRAGRAFVDTDPSKSTFTLKADAILLEVEDQTQWN